MEDQRINWIDMAKGYGILAVFIGHMVQNSVLGSFVYSFHLPLFFFISGYLFKSGGNLGGFLKKKAHSILLPYFTLGLLVVFCNALYPLLFSGHNFSANHLMYELSKEFSAYLFQCRYATLWYLAVLLSVNILMFFVCKIGNQFMQAIIVIAFFAAAMVYYAFGGRELFWNIDAAFPALLFFGAGYFINHISLIDERFKNSSKKPVILAVSLTINIVFNILNLIISGSGLEMYRCSYGMPLFTVISAFSGVFFVVILSIMTTTEPILYIGKNSLIFFMWHQAVVYPPLDALYLMIGIDGYGSNPGSFLLIVLSRLILTCLIMAGLTELIRRTPLRIFTGK